MKNRARLVVLLGLATLLTPQLLRAQNGRTVSSGFWGNAGEWSVGVPTYGGFNAYVGSAIGGHANPAEVTNAFTHGGIGLFVGYGSGGVAATGTVYQTADYLYFSDAGTIGGGASGSAGRVIHSAGSLSTDFQLFIGSEVGTVGTYTFSAGTVTTGSGGYSLIVGRSGTGVFEQSGGHTLPGGQLRMGVSSGAVGTYTLSGGRLSSAERQAIGESGSGIFIQSAGTNTVGYSATTSGYGMRLGLNAGGNGTYTMSGGRLQWTLGSSDGGVLIVGDQGTGTFTQSGGDVVVSSVDGSTDDGALRVGGYDASTGRGTYNISGGTLTVAGAVFVGNTGVGTLTISGGTVKGMTGAFGNGFNVGASAGSTGIVNLTSGTLQLTRVDGAPTLRVGISGVGVFNMGNATSAGFLTNNLTAANRAIVVRDSASGTGTFQGWSRDGSGNRLHLPGILDNSGRVIANSYGNQARSLDFSSLSFVTNTIDNAVGENNGWFAINKGKLTLPKVAVASGNSTVNWGESSTDTTLDLVNSARLALTGVVGGGDLTISLLATDRTDWPGGLVKPIGVWEIDSNFTFTSATLTLRYDEALAAVLGATESNLKLWHYTGGAWSNITASIDLTNKRITGVPVTSFSPFAIAEDLEAVAVVPEPTTVLLFLTGGALIWQKRRRVNQQRA
jgi:hypothetical protein